MRVSYSKCLTNVEGSNGQVDSDCMHGIDTDHTYIAFRGDNSSSLSEGSGSETTADYKLLCAL